MREAITVGYPRDGTAPVVIHGVDTPIVKQLAGFKDLCRKGSSKFALVKVFDTVSRQRKLAEPDKRKSAKSHDDDIDKPEHKHEKKK